MRFPCTIALLLCIGNGLAAAQPPLLKISSVAQWQPGKKTFQMIMDRCLNAPKPGECKAKTMQELGASPQAIAFSKLTGYNGFMRAFRKIGPVDVAYVNYPYRANENNGFLLVNGAPQAIDVDDYKLIPRDDLKADPLYAMLLQSNPNLSVWPGDRWNTRYPVSKKLPGGRQQFLVVYQLQTCHACARLGEATFAFNFDATGKFDGVDLSLVNAASAAGDGVPKAQKPVIVSTSASKPVELAVGQPLNIRLETNPTTGYQWQLAAPFNQAVLKFTSSQQLGAQTGLLGAGSQEILGFKAMGRGETFISLKYVRPWENNALPAKAVTVKVVVK